jgi:D-alanyl-D-alanine carboxypeptidase
MKNQKFRQIVSTKYYKVLKIQDGGAIRNSRSYYWENTQKLLWSKGVNGIKTGITTSAGPCLATHLCKDGYDLIIVLLNCKSTEARWIETNKLANWSIARMNKIKAFQSNQCNAGGAFNNGYNSLLKQSGQINNFE